MFTRAFGTGAAVLQRAVICFPWLLCVDAGRDPDHDEVAGTEAFGGMAAGVLTPQGSGMARQCFVKAAYIVAAPA